MVFCEVNNNWDKHWECLFLVCLQDVEEVIILEEAHCSVSYLQVDTTNASNDPLEKLWNEMLYLIYFTDFEYFLQFCQEESFLDTVCKWPKLQKTF